MRVEEYCYRVKEDGDYDKALRKNRQHMLTWSKLCDFIGEQLGEEITKLGTVHRLMVDLNEIKNEENKKLFKQDGTVKLNVKKAKELNQAYIRFIQEHMPDYREEREINFMFGVMRRSVSDTIERFMDDDKRTYIRTNFNLLDQNNRVTASLEPISAITYYETYLNLLKRREVAKDESQQF